MPQTLNLCPDAVNTAWHIVCSRMKHVKPEDKSSPVSAEVRTTSSTTTRHDTRVLR
jgi:hypothetical protein